MNLIKSFKSRSKALRSARLYIEELEAENATLVEELKKQKMLSRNWKRTVADALSVADDWKNLAEQRAILMQTRKEATS